MPALQGLVRLVFFGCKALPDIVHLVNLRNEQLLFLSVVLSAVLKTNLLVLRRS